MNIEKRLNRKFFYVCIGGDDVDWFVEPLKQWTSLIVGAWRSLTELNFDGFGCGSGGGGAAPFLLDLGEIVEIDSWWPFFNGSFEEKSCSIDFITSSLMNEILLEITNSNFFTSIIDYSLNEHQ